MLIIEKIDSREYQLVRRDISKSIIKLKQMLDKVDNDHQKEILDKTIEYLDKALDHMDPIDMFG